MPSRPSTPPKSAGSARDDERAEKTTEILKKIRTLEIKTRGLVETAFAGNYHSVFKGRGMNFEDVREYQPGDEIRAIDWNVTARMGNAFVKKFTEERELTVMLVVDVSASGNFGSTTQSKRELAAEVACLLAFSAIRNNDKVGLLLFTDRVELFIPPKKGRSHTLRIIREILFFEPQGRGTEPGLALDYLNKIVTRRAVVFFISDFQAPDFSRALAVSGRRSMVARILAITIAGIACSKKGSCSHTAVASPSEITVAQYGFFSFNRARYSSSSFSPCTRCTNTSAPARTTAFWSASVVAWAWTSNPCLCDSSMMAL